MNRQASISRLLFAAFLLAAPLALLARPDGRDQVAIAPTADQTTISRMVYGALSDSRLAYRPRPADEALSMGLANRVVDDGAALDAALALARQIAGFPQQCLRADRASAFAQWDASLEDALKAEGIGGLEPLRREARAGAARFRDGAGRGGAFSTD